MNEYPRRYELKLRSEKNDHGGKNEYKKETYSRTHVENVDKHKTHEDRISFRTGFCVMLLVFTVFLKFSGIEEGKDFLSELDMLINSQFDIARTTQVVSEFVEDAANYFSGNNSGAEFSMPLENGYLYEGFVETVHPVFMTDISPTGITLISSPSSYVYSAESGKVSSVSANPDGTKRVVIRFSKDISFAYDDLAYAYVKKDDLVNKEDMIGLLKEEDPATMRFEVWVDNVAEDPLRYISQEIPAYVQED